MALPVPGQNGGTGEQQLLAIIRRIVEQEVGNALRSLPIQWDPQGNITIPNGGNLTVSGAIESSNYEAGVQGYLLSGTGIEIDTGAVGTSALVNPVATATARASVGGTFGVTTAFATLTSTTITVPAGFTTLSAFAEASMYAVNPNTTGGSDTHGSDALYARANLNGNVSTANPTPLSGSNGYTTAIGFDAFMLTGLTPGSMLTLSVEGKSAFAAMAANGSNFARVAAILVWTK